MEFSLAFLGSGNFALKVFYALIEKKIHISLLLTTPPKPRGRGRQNRFPKIAEYARRLRIKTLSPPDPNYSGVVMELKNNNIDFIVLSDYGKILGREVLNVPKYASINIHPSLLPRYRGSAPLERAIKNGDKVTGYTVFIMDEGIDTGPILYQEEIPVEDRTKGELETIIAKRVSESLLEILEKFSAGKLKPKPQKGEASYAKKVEQNELWIDWNQDAEGVKNQIHALSPSPGARTHIDGKYTKVYKVKSVKQKIDGSPGKIVVKDGHLIVVCGKNAVELLHIQPAGKKIMVAKEYIQGYHPMWAE